MSTSKTYTVEDDVEIVLEIWHFCYIKQFYTDEWNNSSNYAKISHSGDYVIIVTGLVQIYEMWLKGCTRSHSAAIACKPLLCNMNTGELTKSLYILTRLTGVFLWVHLTYDKSAFLSIIEIKCSLANSIDKWQKAFLVLKSVIIYGLYRICFDFNLINHLSFVHVKKKKMDCYLLPFPEKRFQLLFPHHFILQMCWHWVAFDKGILYNIKEK